ncbi:MAG: leucine-rich repeat domain-containing protein, partial [Rikenellaceae bacterium]
ANFPKATTIEQQAFYQCSSLTSADFPEATTIERYAFSGCSKLSSVNFPLVTSIGYYYKSSSAGYAFEGCVSLKSAAFPSVTAIYQYTFYGCDALTSLDLATNEDCVLSTLDVDVFRINDTQTQEGNITLNIGTANSSNVSGNTLTVSGNSYTFSKINVTGGSQSELTASSPNGNGVAW